MIREPKVTELEMLVDIAIEHAKDAGLGGHDDVDRKFVKKAFKQMMISPDFRIFVEEKNGKFIAYAIGKICQKIWNGKRYGELTFIFVHPEARSKSLADTLVQYVEQWFAEQKCDFMQASCMTYTQDYEANDEWLHRVKTYFKTQNMNEVGYHYVKPLESNEWVV
tara:strand:+ start:2080 stop:2574 length:495 start_codon:yes stop_codon:yes gene_type:complete